MVVLNKFGICRILRRPLVGVRALKRRKLTLYGIANFVTKLAQAAKHEQQQLASGAVLMSRRHAIVLKALKTIATPTINKPSVNLVLNMFAVYLHLTVR